MINSNKNKYLDEEERNLAKALNNLDVTKLPTPDKKTQKMFKNAATKFVKQEAKMNIRINPLELEKIKKHAAIEGLKYQTFVKSILHKYLTGQLTERKIS
ncbi:MAG: antitoxin [Chlamydiae bacterium]|nr:MAG: antitoxin [Chlamydiota bacterium]